MLGLRGVNGFAAGLSTYFLVGAPGLLSEAGVVFVDEEDVGVDSKFAGLLILFALLLLLLLMLLLFTELVVDGGVVICTWDCFSDCC